MKKFRFLSFLLLLVFIFTIASCDDAVPKYEEDTLDLLEEKLSLITDIGGSSLVNNDFSDTCIDEYLEVVEKSSEIVVQALKSAGITNTELKNLLELELDFDDLDTYEGTKNLVNSFYDTKITNTKISRFVWAMFVASKNVVSNVSDSLFTELAISKTVILKSYDNVFKCINDTQFVTLSVAVLDTLQSSINFDILASLVSMSESELEPTKAEIKTYIAEAKTAFNSINKIWSDDVYKSYASVLKKVLVIFGKDMMPQEEYSKMEKAIDGFVKNAQVTRKVQTAIINAIDDPMIDIIIDEPTDDEKVIAICKLINAAIDTSASGTGTGLTKQFVLESGYLETLLLINYNLSDLTDNINMIYTEAPKYKNVSYSTSLDYNDEFIIYIYDILYGSYIAYPDIEPYPICQDLN